MTPKYAGAEDAEEEEANDNASASTVEFESSDEEDEDEDERDCEEADYSAMPTPKKPKKKIPQGKPPRKSAPSSLGGLAESLGNLKVKEDEVTKTKIEWFNFDSVVPFMQKDYTKNDIDKHEIEFLCMPFGKEHFRCKLSKCGTVIAFWQATPAFFGEEKRMKSQFGKDINGNSLYETNDPRVIGHNRCVQQVRLIKGKPRHKVFWGEKPQFVKLPVKVEGPPNKSSSLLKVGVINGHRQFMSVIIYVYKVATNKIKREKEMKVHVCDDLSDDSDQSDVDENDDDHRRGGRGGTGDYDDCSMPPMPNVSF